MNDTQSVLSTGLFTEDYRVDKDGKDGFFREGK